MAQGLISKKQTIFIIFRLICDRYLFKMDNNTPKLDKIKALLDAVKKSYSFDNLTTHFFQLRDLPMSDDLFFQDVKDLFVYEVAILRGSKKEVLDFLESKSNWLASQIKQKYYPNNGSVFEYIYRRLKVFVDKTYNNYLKTK